MRLFLDLLQFATWSLAIMAVHSVAWRIMFGDVDVPVVVPELP
jgi:hypothetical protein